MRRIRQSWFRGVALFVALALLGAVILAVQSTRALEAEADALQRLGSNMLFSSDDDANSVLRRLGDLAGLKFQSRLTTHRCIYTGRLTDLPELSPFRELPRMRGIHLGRFPDEDARALVTNDRLAPLLDITDLEVLSIPGRIGATDEFLAALARKGRLEGLSLHSDLLTDAGVGELSTCKQLKMLSLKAVTIGDSLQGLPLENLTRLDLIDVKSTSSSLKCLARCKELSICCLQGEFVSNSIFGSLSGLPRLRELDLSDASVTDAGLDAFAPGPALRVLKLLGTGISNEAATRFADRNPEIALVIGDHEAASMVGPMAPRSALNR